MNAAARRRSVSGDELPQARLQTFKSIKLKLVSLPEEDRLITTGFLTAGSALPLVIEPAVRDSDLAEWAQRQRPFIEERLHRHGAVLFRGFAIDSIEKFERFSLVLCKQLHEDNGEHEMVSGSVATPVFYPPDKQLLWHNENSFNHSWPTRILFCCAEPPARGGETPIVDSRLVYERLPERLRRRFAEKGVMYQRNYGGGLGLDWRAVFHTESRDEVERECQASHTEYVWEPGDRLRTRAVRPAVVRHPVTGEIAWFNQAQHWHTSCLDPVTRQSLLALYAEPDLPRSCCLGDGSPILDDEMATIVATYRELEVSFPWQKGDVLVVDNLLAAHGRNPFEGVRKILVTMGDMKSYDQVQGR
jgi:alpha-ketoglutarate-dependent taurine dioxygenase